MENEEQHINVQRQRTGKLWTITIFISPSSDIFCHVFMQFLVELDKDNLSSIYLCSKIVTVITSVSCQCHQSPIGHKLWMSDYLGSNFDSVELCLRNLEENLHGTA